MAKSAALLRNAGARFAYLHGSRTSGQYRLDSDIDIAVYFGGHPPNAFDILMPPGVEEAGGRDDNPAIHDPGRAWELWNSEVDYAYATEPQVHAAGTRVFWPRGKATGGSGSLNGMIYVRGHHADYDNWAHNGAAGWSYDEVLPS